MQKLHLIVSGKVQGVLYRSFVSRYAINLGLTGWVKNTSDGAVEILAEGKKQDLEQFLLVAKQGPATASVDKVEEKWEESEEEFGDNSEFSIV